MENINGHIINELPFGKLTKVSDLVYYEGPILSHFVNERDENFFFSWVDYDEICNRWLVLQVEKRELLAYLSCEITLENIFNNPENSLLFLVDIDSNGIQQKTYIEVRNVLNKAYIPEKESYYKDVVQQYYIDLIKNDKEFNYLTILKESAFYLKLEPVKKTFATTVSAEDAANFLTNLTESVISFAQIKLKKTNYLDQNPKKIKERLSEFLTPRIIDLKYSSFSVGLSIDTSSNDDLNILTSKWKKEFVSEYKNDVVEADLSNDAVINRIVAKYSIEERHLIYEPFVKATKNKNYYVVKTNKFYNDLSRLYLPTQRKMVILLPKVTKVDEKPVTYDRIGKVEVTEGKVTKQKIKGLFDQDIESMLYPLEKISYLNNVYNFRQPLYCKFDVDEDMVYIENEQLGIYAQGKNKDEAIAMFSEEFDFIYNRYNELPEEKLTEDVIFIKQYLNIIVKK